MISLDNSVILVTGGAGFIGYHLILKLLKTAKKSTIISFDNLNNYYDVRLKEWRLKSIQSAVESSSCSYTFIQGDLFDSIRLRQVFEKYRPTIVVNLAAQAGVRYSIDHPADYINSNIVGFFNILEICRYFPVMHLIFASSSSVYGGNTKIPFSVNDRVDTPVSLYAATKKSNELMAYAYSKLYGIAVTGLRFFTVYGPAGRPDMFYFSATQKLIAGEKIKIFNYGKCSRDFTYIDDIINGVLKVIPVPPHKTNKSSGETMPPYMIYNIGGGNPENLLTFIDTLQETVVSLGLLPHNYDFESLREYVSMQKGDVPITYADSSDLYRDFSFTPKIGIREGLYEFVKWFKKYYNL